MCLKDSDHCNEDQDFYTLTVHYELSIILFHEWKHFDVSYKPVKVIWITVAIGP